MQYNKISESKLDKLEQKYCELGKEIENLKKQNKKIYIPAGMFFIGALDKKLAIKICESPKQAFYESDYTNVWALSIVNPNWFSVLNKEKELELVKITKDEMKNGNWYLIDDIDDVEYYADIAEDIDSYTLKINNNVYYYTACDMTVEHQSLDRINESDYHIYEVRIAK